MQPERRIVYLFKLHTNTCTHISPHSFASVPAVKPARLPIKTDGMEIIYESAHLSSRIFNFERTDARSNTQNEPELRCANSIYSERIIEFRKCEIWKTFIAA